MENKNWMNVLVMGASGAGKSTMIEALAGTKISAGIGEGDTQEISVYESTNWPLRCIDTKGFELSIFDQLKTIRQVKQFTKEQVKKTVDNEEVSIDAVWYCIEGTGGRVFSKDIALMNKATKKWKNVPVFVVITKSYSKQDTVENIAAVKMAFAKTKDINLKEIIPVVAKEYIIDDGIIVAPTGLEELCTKTLEYVDEAKTIAKESIDRMILEQKRYTANMVIVGASTTGAVIGAIPFDFADAVLLVPLETSLTKGVFKVYGVEFSGDLVAGIVGSAMITNLAKQLLKLLTSKIPVAGAILNGIVAAIIIEALGQAISLASEAIYKGNLDPQQIDAVVAFISQKIKDVPVVGQSVAYLEENADKLQGKSAKDVYKAIKGSIEDSVSKEN